LDRSVLFPLCPSLYPSQPCYPVEENALERHLTFSLCSFHTSHITVHFADYIPFFRQLPTSTILPLALDLAHPPFPFTSTTFDRLFDLILLYSRFYFAWHYPEQTRTSPFHTPSFTLIVFPPIPPFASYISTLFTPTPHYPSPFQLHRIITVSH
jgi:hypothetical protein